jgi:hypothetical protein
MACWLAAVPVMVACTSARPAAPAPPAAAIPPAAPTLPAVSPPPAAPTPPAGRVTRIAFLDTSYGIHPFVTFDYDIAPAAIPAIGTRTLFVWGARARNVEAWHRARPGLIVSHYVPFNRDPGDQDLAHWTSAHPDWILYECDRRTPVFQQGTPTPTFDLTNPDVVHWQLANIEGALARGYDAIAFDNFQLDNHYRACGIYRNGRWVQLYDGELRDPRYTANILAWIHQMYLALHQRAKPIGLIPNYVVDRPLEDPELATLLANVDGILDEEGFGNWSNSYITDEKWALRIAFISQLQKMGIAYFSLSGFPTIDRNAIQWVLANYLLVKDRDMGVFVAKTDQYGFDPWRPEYGTAIGAPCGPMIRHDNVYMRPYSGGLALVNPSASAGARLRLRDGGALTNVYGEALPATVELPAHSGLVLLKRGSAPSCRAVLTAP